MKSAILPRPASVGVLRRCPECKRAFGLERVSRDKRGEVSVEKYVCRRCRHEVEYGDRRPRGTI